MKVAIIGASNDSSRFSNRAQRMLLDYGHEVVPISLTARKVLGEQAFESVADVPTDSTIDTVTVYVNPANFESVIDDVLALRPDRVLFNPGSEHPDAAERLRAAGITVVNACTLVMLAEGQF